MILEVMHKGEAYRVVFDDDVSMIVLRLKWHIAHGYARASIQDKTGRHSVSMHRMIAGNIADHIHHVNGDTLDNRRENLVAMTALKHAKHHKKTGNKGWFTRRNRAKLSDEIVIDLRTKYKRGISARELARELGMGHTPVYYAITGKTWKHLPL
jgi:hypothetical protein